VRESKRVPGFLCTQRTGPAARPRAATRPTAWGERAATCHSICFPLPFAKIIAVARSGGRDPAHICAQAIKELGIPIPD
jgi:hypothetical protein